MRPPSVNFMEIWLNSLDNEKLKEEDDSRTKKFEEEDFNFQQG
jgi:hypothetical protein